VAIGSGESLNHVKLGAFQFAEPALHGDGHFLRCGGGHDYLAGFGDL
jgi:hypothetical protein